VDDKTLILELIKANTNQISLLVTQINSLKDTLAVNQQSLAIVQNQLEQINWMFKVILAGVIGLIVERFWKIVINLKNNKEK